jgi:hypothetical protein
VLATFAGVLLLVVSSAATTLAAPPTVVSRNFQFSFLDSIDTESCPGITIEVDLEGVRNWTDYSNADGELVKSIINVRYWFTFTNVDDPSLVVKSPGHRHITFDYVNDIYTDSGIYRNGTMPGAGNVLQVAGRTIETLESAEFISATPKRVEILDEFCSALGG